MCTSINYYSNDIIDGCSITITKGGSNGAIAFFRYTSCPTMLFLIKIQLHGAELHYDNICHEYIILKHIKKQLAKYPGLQEYIMTTELGFQSSYTQNTIEFNCQNTRNLNCNCFLSKANSCTTSLNNMLSSGIFGIIQLEQLDFFFKCLLHIRDQMSPGFCHNDFHSDNIMYNNRTKSFFLIDFGRAYMEFTNVEEEKYNSMVNECFVQRSQLFSCPTDISKQSLINNSNLWCDFAGLISMFGDTLLSIIQQNKNLIYLNQSIEWGIQYRNSYKSIYRHNPTQFEGSGIFNTTEYHHFMGTYKEDFDALLQSLMNGGCCRRILKRGGGEVDVDVQTYKTTFPPVPLVQKEQEIKKILVPWGKQSPYSEHRNAPEPDQPNEIKSTMATWVEWAQQKNFNKKLLCFRI